MAEAPPARSTCGGAIIGAQNPIAYAGAACLMVLPNVEPERHPRGCMIPSAELSINGEEALYQVRAAIANLRWDNRI